jgi:hypothetical protein
MGVEAVLKRTVGTVVEELPDTPSNLDLLI